MVGIMTASRHADDVRRRTKRIALKGGAVVARRLLNRTPVRCDLSPAPGDTGLQPIPGDKGLPIVGHALLAATLPIEFLGLKVATKSRLSYNTVPRPGEIAVVRY